MQILPIWSWLHSGISLWDINKLHLIWYTKYINLVASRSFAFKGCIDPQSMQSVLYWLEFAIPSPNINKCLYKSHRANNLVRYYVIPLPSSVRSRGSFGVIPDDTASTPILLTLTNRRSIVNNTFPFYLLTYVIVKYFWKRCATPYFLKMSFHQ